MVFDDIELLKKEWTDKYVVIDETRPELLRFRGLTGTVRTVNMSGKALVEFDGAANIGWYDIDTIFLKQISEPLPKVEKAKGEKKPAEKAPAKPAPAKASAPAGAPSAKSSVTDVLAAARAGKAAPQKTEVPGPSAAKSTADILAAARAKASPAAAPAETKLDSKVASSAPASKPAGDPKNMSTADVLAMARGKKAEGAAPAAPKPAAAKEPAKAAKVVSEPAPEPEPEPVAPPASKGTKDKASLPKDVAGMLAYCRQVDAKA